ncbi:hypothetical protein [Streptomyces sp. NPDC005438]|uniref:hypothetical protein n=1 Tax=Streptomyces sp. NPDC005438 TaxID=3156880 RepID=UPI0033A97741
MKKFGYRPKGEVTEQTKRVSSKLYGAVNIKGKTTRPGPYSAACDDPDETFQIRHSWSIYGVPFATLEKGFYRLRDKLPEEGWKIARQGREKSKAHDRYVEYEHDNYKHGVRVILFERTEESPNPAGLHFDVASACYSSK